MNSQPIKIDNLIAHPANSNVMPEHLLQKLVAHIENTKRYPPVIVRPITQEPGGEHVPWQQYQILDGHHRIQALKHLGHESARCEVWEVDDQEALLLLATLNRLQGQDDPRKRASLITALTSKQDTNTLAKLLPERSEQVKKLLEIHDAPPKPRDPQPIADMPVAVYFFLTPKQKCRLNTRLKQIEGTREDALMRLVDQPHD